MAKERLPMRKVREILRMRWELGLSVREVAKSLGVSVGVVSKAVNRAELAGLDWASVQPLSETELEAKLYGQGSMRDKSRPAPDPVVLHADKAYDHRLCRTMCQCVGSSPGSRAAESNRRPGLGATDRRA